jgi:hypothetical protein
VGTVVLGLIGVAMWANPALILWVWVVRLRQPQDGGLRCGLGWLSLVLSTVGLLIFFVGMGTSPAPATPAFDHWFAEWFRACIFTSVATLIVGLLGLGKRQWIVVLSAFITPLSCILQKVLE